jgi:hypothetical protein
MKEFTTNRFYKGINTDLSLLERQADVLLDALNVRLTSKETDGLFAANIKGNVEEFQLSTDFLPIGSVEFNGILFVFSVNSTSGEGEIGTFPSPNGTSQGFTRTYSPLQNFTLDNPNLYVDPCEGEPNTITRQDFTTDLLNFSCEHQIRVVARLDFDKSINLYWTDNFNPIRSINTGFHSETGEFNDRYVSQFMVSDGTINIISESEFIPIVKLNSLDVYGSNKGGNYFFFVRYVDISFNTSSFIGMSNAVPVFNEKEMPFAVNDIAYGVESQNPTNKNILLDITGLDPNQAFIEIGYIYYFGVNEFEIKLIDNRIPINGGTSLSINVIGSESTFDLSLDEFIGYKPVDAVHAKDIAQLDNRLYIANTRGIQLDHPDLREFFCSIEIGEDSSFSKDVGPLTETGDNDQIYGIDPLEVHEKVGYWSGETYIFAGVPILKGGFTGPAFPLKGFDNYNGLNENPNFNGIYRFSKASVNPYFSSNTVYVKGVTFNTLAADTVYNNSQYLKDNLIGFYFCRGERAKNILYQGLAVPTYSGFTTQLRPKNHFDSLKLAGGLGSTIIQTEFFKSIPLIEPAYPYWILYYTVVGIDEVPNEFFGYSYFGQEVNSFDNICIMSSDFHIDMGLSTGKVGTSSFLERVGKIDDPDWSPRAPINSLSGLSQGVIVNQYPLAGGASGLRIFEQNDITPTTTGPVGYLVDTYNVNAWDASGETINSIRHVSKIGEGSSVSGMFYVKEDRELTDNNEFLISMPLSTPSYILTDKSTASPSYLASDILQHIINVCEADPTLLDYNNKYDFKNTLFSPITKFLKISDLASINSKIFYQGDCFVAKTYLKYHHEFTDEIGDELLTTIATSAGGSLAFKNRTYGYVVGLVTENNYNPNHRFSKGRNSYYPKDISWATRRDSPEANFYNTGYQRMLNPRKFLGIDKLKPFSDNSFPTRIWPSFKHILNSLKDGYLQFSDSKDFDYQYGPINAIISHNDQLFSFQNDAINLHPINERSVSNSDSTDTPFILGESRGLTEFKRALSTEYGTQHQWSVIIGERGIYGVDWNKQCVWRVGANGFENLGIQKSCEKWIEDIINLSSSGVSDITELLPDNPVCNLGVHSVFDREYKEVLMTFILGDGNNKTISYSEKGDFFNTKYSFTPIFYAELEKDLYSFSGNSFWRHDANPLYDNFYGQQHPAFIEFVVNPKGEIAKHFDNLIISSNNREFSKIEFNTQHQQALQDPFLGEFFSRAVYREFQWKLPIRRADSITDPQMSLAVVQSRMRGRYLIINLEYAGDQDMWVREVITAYTQSKG